MIFISLSFSLNERYRKGQPRSSEPRERNEGAHLRHLTLRKRDQVGRFEGEDEAERRQPVEAALSDVF
jgi:hypothetical protein